MNDLDNYKINYTLINRENLPFLKNEQIIPIKEYPIFIVCGVVGLENEQFIDSHIFSKPIKGFGITQDAFDFELHNIEEKSSLFYFATKAVENYDQKSNESAILYFLEKLFIVAITKNSSDIHIETLKDGVIFRFRIDGILVQFFHFELQLYPIVSSSIKLLAKLDISQKRIPQNGRFTQILFSKEYDFRISILPTLEGESIVMRILDNQKAFLGLQYIGLCEDIYKSIKKSINLSHGMILITGATGSGKTTTMYSILNELDKKRKKIITIEDPIEYNIDGVMQVPINEEIGLSYELVLKNILRQDPDVIMIGEIRDENALKIALQASLTGHLVIATLHTNDAAKTINRLLDLGAKPYVIASVVRLIVSQKLIRILCSDCKEAYLLNEICFYKSKGCPKCNLSGYSGRTIVTEFLEFDEQIQKMVQENIPLSEIISYGNYSKIGENAYKKVLDGTTSLSEYYSYEI